MDPSNTLDFLLEHQAAHAARIEELENRNNELRQLVQSKGESIDAMQAQMAKVVSVLERFTVLYEQADRRLDLLTENGEVSNSKLEALIGIIDSLIHVKGTAVRAAAAGE